VFDGNVSEDCLYLNIWVPANAGAVGPAAYPVMIFFHGGSYISGSAMLPIYGGEIDVKAHKDVVIIAANYRC
jgi:para-nitrobenzyl esterase